MFNVKIINLVIHILCRRAPLWLCITVTVMEAKCKYDSSLWEVDSERWKEIHGCAAQMNLIALVEMTSAVMKVIIITIVIIFVHKHHYYKQFVKSISVLCNCVILFCTDYKKLIIEFLTPCFYVFISNKSYWEIVRLPLDLGFFSSMVPESWHHAEGVSCGSLPGAR